MRKKRFTTSLDQQSRQSIKEPEVIRLRDFHEEELASVIAEQEKSRPQVAGEQSAAGSMPNPERITAKTTVERAKKMGVYKKSK